MSKGVLKQISTLDYLQLYQKRGEKKHYHGWFTALEKHKFSHSFLVKTLPSLEIIILTVLWHLPVKLAIILILHFFCMSLLCLGRRLIISHRFSTPTPLGNAVQFADTGGGRYLYFSSLCQQWGSLFAGQWQLPVLQNCHHKPCFPLSLLLALSK